ncbi:hypothetical protein GBAR_LOCUS17855 [Geodia barretti]|uniref:Uncharacterized protein n=1 Tax=Geodia barretti TaxID=519541 RepID=A0AA35WSR5_GEOBA|nr:hypothetical protein GBAR_LOCUS17855 [Geodia barretti]
MMIELHPVRLLHIHKLPRPLSPLHILQFPPPPSLPSLSPQLLPPLPLPPLLPTHLRHNRKEVKRLKTYHHLLTPMEARVKAHKKL